MNGFSITGLVLLGLLVLGGLTYMSTYNGFMRKDQNIVETERKVASCYQKRSDLLTNLEATVNRYATHEQSTQTGVAQARAGAGQVKIPENATPEQLAAAQTMASSVFSRLMAVAEATPNLKADRQFLDIQKQLRDTENQCNVLRNRQIEAVKVYNTSLTTFPSNIIAGMHGLTKKEQLTFEDEMTNRKSPRLFQNK